MDRGRRGRDMVIEMKVKGKIEKRNGDRVQRRGRKAYRERKGKGKSMKDREG